MNSTVRPAIPGQPAIKEPKKLGEFHATAICGNDITSSCLYVSALALLWAGPWAPISLLIVSVVLWLYRGIYAEVVGALPLNGGAYNALLNTTSKSRASIAACLTILSYLATAVISASEAIHYLASAFESIAEIHPTDEQLLVLTIALLGVFAFLTIRGIGESAKVASGIFVFHISTMTMLLILGGTYVFFNGLSVFEFNLTSLPPIDNPKPILFGFFVAMLGISGFESSANFVEEQKDGVFPKTLRNMWIAVTVFNPLMACLALAIVPLPDVYDNTEALLAHMGNVAVGEWFSIFISINAGLVLSGAVLTSFIGTTGLVHRMTLDRCLPQTLLTQSRWGTYHRIVITFFILAVGLTCVARDVTTLAGVYTISFLSVMILFAVGNALLKLKRNRLPRPTKVSWLTITLALIATLTGLIGNIYMKHEYFKVFLFYFIPTVLIVYAMLERTTILKVLIYVIRSFSLTLMRESKQLTNFMEDAIDEINSQQVVFFTRGDNIANLNQAMLYVRENEHSNRIKIVTVVKDREEALNKLDGELDFLDKAYPEIQIEYVIQEGDFTPELLNQLSTEWKIPLNFMFIGSPGTHFPHRISSLGGVRLII